MRADRLLKLADFLDTMPREKFNFGVIARERGLPMLEALAAGHTPCGTVGCAIGWMPAVFPDEIKWKPYYATEGLSVLDGRGNADFDVAVAFFEITAQEADYLFMPTSDDEFGGDYSGLPSTASPRLVAAHIREFVEERNEVVVFS